MTDFERLRRGYDLSRLAQVAGLAERLEALEGALSRAFPGGIPAGGVGDLICPVGGIYLSVSDRDPALLFGGSWERIEDCFLLAAGEKHAAGETGGEEAHVLSLEELPAHQHKAQESKTHAEGAVYGRSETGAITYGWGSSGGGYAYLRDVNTSRTGGGKAHNNLPPYRAVYVWRRVA